MVRSSSTGTLDVTNSSFENNTASSAGGAIGNFGTVTTLKNSTISNNSASSAGRQGGGIYNQGTMFISKSVITNNSIPVASRVWEEEFLPALAGR